MTSYVIKWGTVYFWDISQYNQYFPVWFPDGLVASTWCSQRWGLGSIPVQGANPSHWRFTWASELSVLVPSSENEEGWIRKGIQHKICARIKKCWWISDVAQPKRERKSEFSFSSIFFFLIEGRKAMWTKSDATVVKTSVAVLNVFVSLLNLCAVLDKSWHFLIMFFLCADRNHKQSYHSLIFGCLNKM